ncbi:general stress protein [Bacillus glycinifermentans]|uniref:General stress protein n=1 Tax=Bacillus glycinifermentans TaxID=1664069 RepID=A0A0J6EQD5_9BACI|nr:general stress protein [Bacillus glycinifermentans]ATH94689.1 general stress protein [Bacillus glycinifermentans]KMM57252.1 general stress protein [Bacillus glycinifermentans]KRT93571.1 general stress protein [Bacillus glycinifermentans]MEC0486017.1 general stress protein [Bacillus glycinifermentans]MEC0496664.1 general stress protein [Bacillus glycinifermentans]
MKPVVREYTNDEKLMKDINELKEIGVAREDIYVLSHDDDRTERIAENTDANTIGAEETGIKNAVGNFFNKKGDELRNKIHEIGFSKQEAEQFEKHLDEGKVLLFVTDYDKVKSWV